MLKGGAQWAVVAMKPRPVIVRGIIGPIRWWQANCYKVTHLTYTPKEDIRLKTINPKEDISDRLHFLTGRY